MSKETKFMFFVTGLFVAAAAIACFLAYCNLQDPSPREENRIEKKLAAMRTPPKNTELRIVEVGGSTGEHHVVRINPLSPDQYDEDLGKIK